MDIKYSNHRIERACTDFTYAVVKYGDKNASRLVQRIKEIKAASSIEFMIEHRIGRCHPLKGDRKNQYGLDLVHPARLVIEKTQNGYVVLVIEIVDYH